MTATARAVVVNWNGAHLLPACLNSLLAQDLAQGELDIVVVDNASTDSSTTLLATHYPSVRVLVTEKNLGFAGGVNVGLADLDAEFAILLNNDATFAPDAVRHLVMHLRDPLHARVGAATAQILLAEPDSEGRIVMNSTGNVLTHRGGAADRGWLAPLGGMDNPSDAPENVFGFCGGAAALRRTALEDVGLFDDGLFLYYEDTDLSWRLRAKGWTVHYVAASVAQHLHAASSDAASARFRYFNTRNSLRVFTRHAPSTVVLASYARQLAGLARHALTRDEGPELLGARRRALAAALRALPADLRVRRHVWATAHPRLRRETYRLGLDRSPGADRAMA